MGSVYRAPLLPLNVPTLSLPPPNAKKCTIHFYCHTIAKFLRGKGGPGDPRRFFSFFVILSFFNVSLFSHFSFLIFSLVFSFIVAPPTEFVPHRCCFLTLFPNPSRGSTTRDFNPLNFSPTPRIHIRRNNNNNKYFCIFLQI